MEFPLNIESPEYVKLFKELSNIFSGKTHNLRFNRGLIGCKWSALFYYVLYLFHKHRIHPDYSIDLLHKFMNHIFKRRRGFLVAQHESLRPLQVLYYNNRLSDPGQYEEIDSVQSMTDMITGVPPGITVFELGIAIRYHASDVPIVDHFFVVVVDNVGGTLKMWTISSWRGAYASISQFAHEFTLEDIPYLLEDILGQETIPVGTFLIDTSKDRPILNLTEAQLEIAQKHPIWEHFLNPEYGLRMLADKQEFYNKINIQGKEFYANPGAGSFLELCEYKSQNDGVPMLCRFTQATAIMDTIFDEFKTLYVRDKHMEPKHGIFDKLFTRATKKLRLAQSVIRNPSTTHTSRKKHVISNTGSRIKYRMY